MMMASVLLFYKLPIHLVLVSELSVKVYLISLESLEKTFWQLLTVNETLACLTSTIILACVTHFPVENNI